MFFSGSLKLRRKSRNLRPCNIIEGRRQVGLSGRASVLAQVRELDHPVRVLASAVDQVQQLFGESVFEAA